MCCESKNIELGLLASSVRAEIIYDLKFDINILEFYRIKFDKDREIEKGLNNYIYK